MKRNGAFVSNRETKNKTKNPNKNPPMYILTHITI